MSLPASYFDAMYDESRDPWGFASRWYEQRKRALTMAALPRHHFRRAFEPGCSIGVLTEELSDRCDELLATDVVDSALAAVRRRVATMPHVTVEKRSIDDWPDGRFDLVVLSEVAYYLDAGECVATLARASQSLVDDGVLLAVHWRHPVTDYPLTGDEVHEMLDATAGLRRLARWLDDDLVLDVMVASTSTGSVAAAEGLV